MLLAIALPLLLLLAARRGGDMAPGPGAIVPLFGRPPVVWAIVTAAAVLLGLFTTVLQRTRLAGSRPRSLCSPC